MSSARKKASSRFLSPQDLLALNQLPRIDHVWIGERRSTQLVDEEHGALDLCLWYDSANDDLRAGLPLPWGDDKSALARLIVQAMLEPDSGEPCVPAEIHVLHAEEATTLKAGLEPLGIRVVVAESPPDLDEVFERVERLMDFPDVWNYLEVPGVVSAQVARLHDLAVRAYGQVNWDEQQEESPLLVMGRQETPVWVTVMASAPDVRSLVLMFSDDPPEKLAPLLASGKDVLQSLTDRLKTLSVSYVPVEQMAPEMIGLARQEGWRVTPDAHLPLLIGMPPDGRMELPDAGEIEHAIVALERMLDSAEGLAGLSEPKVVSLAAERDRRRENSPSPFASDVDDFGSDPRGAREGSGSQSRLLGKPEAGSEETLYRLRVELTGSKSPIWRSFTIPASCTLADLHEVLQDAMGWGHDHPYEFTWNRRVFAPDAQGPGEEPATGMRLQDMGLRKRSHFSYCYDLGNQWRHEVRFEEKVGGPPEGPALRCLGGEGACPREGCGGGRRYARELEDLADSTSKFHGEMLERYGERFDPSHIDIHEVNRRLQKLEKRLLGSRPSGRRH